MIWEPSEEGLRERERKRFAEREARSQFDSEFDWADAAWKLGIRVVSTTLFTNTPTVLEGQIDEFDVTVKWKKPIYEGPGTTEYLVGGLRWPNGIAVRPRQIRRSWSRSFRTGDADWDKLFVVKTRSADHAKAYLTADRRSALDTVRRAIGRRWEVRNGSLTVSRFEKQSGREVVLNVNKLVAHAKAVHGLA